MPLHNAIVWQDRRTADRCSALKRDKSMTRKIQRKTGLIPDAYFSASKLEWLLDHVPKARVRAARGELAFGTVDSWLLWNLTGGVHATDVSNASRTMLFNIHTAEWDDELLNLFRIPREVLPSVMDSAGLFGEARLGGAGGWGGAMIPVAGIAGDQQAALFGQNCLSPGLAKNTYGTGCFLLQNIGETAARSENQLLTTIAWRLPAKVGNQKSKLTYALEGSVFIGGAVVQWLRDGLGIIKNSGEVEKLAATVPDSGGLYIVPAFAGLGAPYWDPYARGTIAGITRGTTAAHFARAALEAIAFQVADLLEVMRADAHDPIRQLRVDGGASKNDLLLQFQADLLQIPVLRPKITETTALGAALLAGVGAGLLKTGRELQAIWKPAATLEPKLSAHDASDRRARWSEALRRARDWEPSGS
jgi:glycerol kinase